MANKESGFSLQDVVYNLDAGMGLHILRILLYIGMVMVLAMLYTASQFRGLNNESAMDSAQIARNISYGRGYTTKNISPVSLTYVWRMNPEQRGRVQNHPELIRPPLYPALLASVFRVSRGTLQPFDGRGTYAPEQYFITPINNALSIITGFLVFLIGRKLFDRRLGFLAMTVYYLSDVIWSTSITGTELPLLLFLTTTSFYSIMLAAEARENNSKLIKWMIPYLIAAGTCVLAFLTRYGAFFMLPTIALYIALRFKTGRLLWVSVFTALFFAGIAPWLLRNYLSFGMPLGLAPYMMFNDGHGSWLADITSSLSLGQFFGRGVFRSWTSNVASFYRSDLHMPGMGLLAAFFFASFFYGFARRDVRIFRWSVALGIFALVSIAGFFGRDTIRLLYVFSPFVMIYGLAFFFLLLERMRISFRFVEISVISLVIASAALPLVFTLMPPRAALPYPPYYPPFISYVSSLMRPGELMSTDMPWATAWYGDQDSLRLPHQIDHFYDINDNIHLISGLYFTTITRDQPFVRTLRTGRYRTWFPVMGGQIPQDFPLSSGFPLNNLDQLFLTDYRRWQEGPRE